MARYFGIIEPAEESGYVVSFPDFPGCNTEGDTLDEAYAMAEDALVGHVRAMLADNDPLPAPRTLDHALSGAGPGALPVAVAAPNTAPRFVRISMTVPEDALAEIDAYAESEGLARSTFLVQAARRAIREGTAG
jgi:predicted RNase H-like HicB family nuclease